MGEQSERLEITSTDLLAEFRRWYGGWLKKRMSLEIYRDDLRACSLATDDVDCQLSAMDEEYASKWGVDPRTPFDRMPPVSFMANAGIERPMKPQKEV